MEESKEVKESKEPKDLLISKPLYSNSLKLTSVLSKPKPKRTQLYRQTIIKRRGSKPTPVVLTNSKPDKSPGVKKNTGKK